MGIDGLENGEPRGPRRPRLRDPLAECREAIRPPAERYHYDPIEHDRTSAHVPAYPATSTGLSGFPPLGPWLLASLSMIIITGQSATVRGSRSLWPRIALMPAIVLAK